MALPRTDFIPRGRPRLWDQVPADVPVARAARYRPGRVTERWQHYSGAQLERVLWAVPTRIWLGGRRVLRSGCWHLYWRADDLVAIGSDYFTSRNRWANAEGERATPARLQLRTQRWAAELLEAHAAKLGERLPLVTEYSVFRQPNWHAIRAGDQQHAQKSETVAALSPETLRTEGA